MKYLLILCGIALVGLFVEESLQSCTLVPQKRLFSPKYGYSVFNPGLKCDDIEDIAGQGYAFHSPAQSSHKTSNSDDTYIIEVTIKSSPSYIGLFPPEIKYIRSLRIEHTDLEALDPNSMKIFLNLEEIYLSNNKIEKIGSSLFGSLKYLTILDLSHNRIDILDGNSFEGNTNLTELFLNNNNINILPQSLFKRLKELSYLDLSNNPIQHTGSSILAELDNLSSLRMCNTSLGNNIEIVKNSNVQILDLSKNSLTRVTQSMFSSLTNLQYLDLSYNSISSLENCSFCDTFLLKILNLYNNRITTIPEVLFSNQLYLEHLDISNNPLEVISVSFLKNLSIVSTLHMKNINLNNSYLIPNIIYKDLNISVIVVSNNLLTRILPQMFSNLPHLLYLDISSNLIECLDENAFLGLSSLTFLNIRTNYIESLPSTIFKHTTSLEYLDLSNNKLRNLPIGIFEGCQGLRRLNLSFNSLEYLSRYTTYRLKNLRELYIENNIITKIEGANYLMKLRKISLHNNPWTCKDLFEFLEVFDDEFSRNKLNVISALNTSQITSYHIRHISCDSGVHSSKTLQDEISENNRKPQTKSNEFVPQRKTLSDIDISLQNLLKELRKSEKNLSLNFTKTQHEHMTDVNINLANILDGFRKYQYDTSNDLKNIVQKMEDREGKLIRAHKSSLASNYNIDNDSSNFISEENLNDYQNTTSVMMHIEKQVATSTYVMVFAVIGLICAVCIIVYVERKKRSPRQNREDLLLYPKI